MTSVSPRKDPHRSDENEEVAENPQKKVNDETTPPPRKTPKRKAKRTNPSEVEKSQPTKKRRRKESEVEVTPKQRKERKVLISERSKKSSQRNSSSEEERVVGEDDIQRLVAYRKSPRRARRACPAEETERETIWKIVKRNFRPKVRKETNGSENEENDANAENTTDDFASFGLDFLNSSSNALGEETDDTDPFTNLFSIGGNDAADALLNDVGIGESSLTLNDDGTLGLSELFYGNSSTLLEGRTLLNENMLEGAYRVKPFKDAYKYTKGKKWGKEETNKFYDALRKCGSDLMMIKTFFPDLTEKQVVNKYKMEEKRNPEKFNAALSRKQVLKIDDFEKIHGRIDISTHYHPENDPTLESETTEDQPFSSRKSTGPSTTLSNMDSGFQDLFSSAGAVGADDDGLEDIFSLF